jgi:hypothetical protein
MTARELFEAVEALGGTLTLHGDKIRCSVPEDGTDLIDFLRTQREGVLYVLQRRDDELPWPGYNNGKRFVCDRCGREFARSVGFAKHKVKEHEFLM